MKLIVILKYENLQYRYNLLMIKTFVFHRLLNRISPNICIPNIKIKTEIVSVNKNAHKEFSPMFTKIIADTFQIN